MGLDADLYYEAGRAGMDPDLVDRLENWQVAARMGVDRERHRPEPTVPGAPRQPGEVVPSGPSDLLRARVAAAEGGPAVDPDAFAPAPFPAAIDGLRVGSERPE